MAPFPIRWVEGKVQSDALRLRRSGTSSYGAGADAMVFTWCRQWCWWLSDLPDEGAVEPVQKKRLRGQVSGGGILRMPKAGAGAPLDLQDERSKGGHPIQLGRGMCSLLRVKIL